MLSLPYRILVLLILTITMIPASLAVGLLHTQIDRVPFQPGETHNYQFWIRNANYNVEVDIAGAISQFATLSPVTRDSSNGLDTFAVTVNIPAQNPLEPGVHYLEIRVTEKGTTGGNVGALTAVEKKIRFEVYSDDKQLQAKFSAPNANQHEELPFSIVLESWTYQKIGHVYADIIIEDNQGAEIDRLRTEAVSLNSGEHKTLTGRYKTDDLLPGNYNARAIIHYDDLTLELEDEFVIGELVIQVVDHTKDFVADQIQEFKVDVKSYWNNHVDDISAELTINDKTLVKTASVSLDPLESNTLQAFWNASLRPATYDAKIKINFAGASVFEPTQIVVSPAPENKEPISPVVMLLSGVIVLLLAVVLLLYKRNPKKAKGKRKRS